MISREQAQLIAESKLARSGRGVRDVVSADEVARPPLLYAGPDLARCWIAYVDMPDRGPQESTVIVIDRETGDVVYEGGAHDEG